LISEQANGYKNIVGSANKEEYFSRFASRATL
jgi:hypothetical protein